MKLLLFDQNISPRLIERLADLFPGSVHVSTLGMDKSIVSGHYEVTGSTVTKYYFAGAQRVAMRTGSTLSYLLSDHLGSTSLTTNSSGGLVSELRYKPWGETRYSSGTTATKYQYTGQYSNMSDFGLMFYNARWYDPALGRFAQADTIIPQNQGVQAWDRYAYTNNNPLRYVDPSGHCIIGAILGLFGVSYSCPNETHDLGALIHVPVKDEGGPDIFVPVSGNNEPLIFVPVSGDNLPDIFVGVPEDNRLENFDPAPNDDSLGIIAETEGEDKGSEEDDIESPYGFPDNNGEPPVEGWEWKGNGQPGSSQGQWRNPDAPKENLHWDDENHLDEFPDGHWDYRDPYGNEYRIGPDGFMTPK